MQFLEIDALTGYSAALDALTEGQRAALVEIVFCYRLGFLSATAVFADVEALRDVAGRVPAEIEVAVTRRYGVDLESLIARTTRPVLRRWRRTGNRAPWLHLFPRRGAGRMETISTRSRLQTAPPDRSVRCYRRGKIDRRGRKSWWSRSMEWATGVAGKGQAGRISRHFSRKRRKGSVLHACISIVTAAPAELFMKCSFSDTRKLPA